MKLVLPYCSQDFGLSVPRAPSVELVDKARVPDGNDDNNPYSGKMRSASHISQLEGDKKGYCYNELDNNTKMATKYCIQI